MFKNKLLLILFTNLPFILFAQVQIVDFTEMTTGDIKKYEKFEIGFNLENLSASVNPYNPDEVDVYAIFTGPSGQQYRRDGFYMIEYVRIDSTESWDEVDSTQQLHWRVRFAPDEIGKWNYVVVAQYLTTPISSVDSYIESFDCVTSENKGFLQVSGNNRYMEFSEGESFFGLSIDMRAFENSRNVPDDLSAPPPNDFPCYGTPGPCPSDENWCHSYEQYQMYESAINSFGNNGGNLVRIWMEPYSYEIENSYEVGKYDRQKEISDLDLLVDLLESKDMYMHLVLYNEQNLEELILDSFPCALNDNLPCGGNNCENAGLPFGMPTGCSDGCWYVNPYRRCFGLNNIQDFFTNTNAINQYLKRLRYIHARWGYSRSIASYGVINEPDLTGSHMGGSDSYLGSSSLRSAINNWIIETGNYLKNLDYPQHMISVDFAASINLPADVADVLNFTNYHYYTNDKHSDSQMNYLVAQNLDYGDKKPVIITEFASRNTSTQCSPIEQNILELFTTQHNNIWSSSFSGAFGNAMYFDSWSKFNHPCSQWDNPSGIYGPLGAFLSGESFNLANPYKFNPIGNGLKTYELYLMDEHGGVPVPDIIPDSLNTPPEDNPNSGSGNVFMAIKSKFIDRSSEYLSRDVTVTFSTTDTTANREVGVYALKRNNRVIGWVHNRNHYWYNIPHFENQPNLYTGDCDFINNNGQQTDDINSVEMTIENLECRGRYKIEWFATFPDKMVNNVGQVINGGIIDAYTDDNVISVDGTVTVTIPDLTFLVRELDPSSGIDTYTAPDYGFKLTLMESYSHLNPSWHHTTLFADDDIDVTGDIVVDEGSSSVYFKGENNYLNQYWWDGNGWNHVVFYDAQVCGDIVVDSGSGSIYFRGCNGYLHQYWWDGSGWNHSTFWQQMVCGDVAVDNSTGNVYFAACDGSFERLHEYSWVQGTGWSHNIIDATGKICGDIEVDPSTSTVYVRGCNKRVKAYQKDGTGTWQLYTPNWQNQNRVKDGGDIAIDNNNSNVYYHGIDDDKIHQLVNNGSGNWTHSVITTSSPLGDATVCGDIAVDSNSGNIYFKGCDGHINQFWSNTGIWNHTVLLYDNQILASGNHVAVDNATGSVYFAEVDNAVGQYYYLDYCNQNKMRVANTIVRDSSGNGILDNKDEQTSLFTHYPNPTKNLLFIEALSFEKSHGKKGQYKVALHDINGMAITQKTMQGRKESLDMSGIASGIYIVTVTNTETGEILHNGRVVIID